MYRSNNDWRNYCAKFLAINSECYVCGTKATVVDHIRPHRGDETLFKKTDNHIPLCAHHHNYVSAKFDTKYVVGGSIDEKLRWLNSRRIPTDDWAPKKVRVLPSFDG
jgi:5-methylcytosine-specific restriction endonuclease McrA